MHLLKLEEFIAVDNKQGDPRKVADHRKAVCGEVTQSENMQPCKQLLSCDRWCDLRTLMKERSQLVRWNGCDTFWSGCNTQFSISTLFWAFFLFSTLSNTLALFPFFLPENGNQTETNPRTFGARQKIFRKYYVSICSYYHGHVSTFTTSKAQVSVQILFQAHVSSFKKFPCRRVP